MSGSKSSSDKFSFCLSPVIRRQPPGSPNLPGRSSATRSHCASLKTNRIKAASIFAALNQIRLAGIPYKCHQALVRIVVMAMVRRRYDRAACGVDISLVRQQAGVNFRMIGDVRAAKAEGIRELLCQAHYSHLKRTFGNENIYHIPRPAHNARPSQGLRGLAEEMILGIDIGVQGAVAIIDQSGGLVEIHDMPTLQDGPAGRRAVNAPLLASIIFKSHAVRNSRIRCAVLRYPKRTSITACGRDCSFFKPRPLRFIHMLREIDQGVERGTHLPDRADEINRSALPAQDLLVPIIIFSPS
jgi:hypothetical protein